MAQARDLGRYLQPDGLELPRRIGSVAFELLRDMVAVRCPPQLDPLMRKAGGMWEPGGKRWLISRRRVGPLIRNLPRVTDPLFRRVGMDLDQPPDGGQEETYWMTVRVGWAAERQLERHDRHDRLLARGVTWLKP